MRLADFFHDTVFALNFVKKVVYFILDSRIGWIGADCGGCNEAVVMHDYGRYPTPSFDKFFCDGWTDF